MLFMSSIKLCSVTSVSHVMVLNGQVGTLMIGVIIVNSCHCWQERGREIYSCSYIPDSDI